MAMAAYACSTMNSHVAPPTPVESTHVGRRPMYSATSTGASIPVPQDMKPSTSSLVRPASASARDTPCWQRWNAVLSSTRPMSDSAAPTTATRRVTRSPQAPLDPLARLEEPLALGDRVLVRAHPDVCVRELERLLPRVLLAG